MFRTSGRSREFDAEACFLSLPLDLAKSMATEATEASFNPNSNDPLDAEHNYQKLHDELERLWPKGVNRDMSKLIFGVAATCHSLAAARWRTLGGERPEHPVVTHESLYGALLIHLHGSPSGPVAEAIREQYEQHANLYGSRRWRAASPSKEALVDYARENARRENSLLNYLRNLEG